MSWETNDTLALVRRSFNLCNALWYKTMLDNFHVGNTRCAQLAQPMRAAASYPLVTLDAKMPLLPTWTMLALHDLCLLAVLHAVLHMTPLVMIGALSAGGDWAANGVATSSRFSAERAGFMATPSN